MKFYSSVETPHYPHANHLYTLDTDSFCIDVDPIDRKRYRASAEVASLGPLTVARVESNAAIVTRKNERHVDREPRYSFIFAVQGDVIISHRMGNTELEVKDFVLLGNEHQRTMFVYNAVTLLIITVPVPLLKKYIPRPEDVAGLKMSHSQLNNGFLFETLLSSWLQIKQGTLKDFAPSLSESLLKNITQAYSESGSGRTSKCTRRMTQVKELIEQNLGNPELTVEMLANELKVSSRYLRALFSNSERISHYILRRRLEECARQLSNSLYRNISITSIAFQWGFNSPAHFSRAFRQKYGMTPREYRKQSTPQ